MTTLVGYASAKGSTRGIAERIVTVLDRTDVVTGPVPLDEVVSVHSYTDCVLGSAIHNGRWLPEAAEAVERLAPTLSGKTVWAFSVSSVGATSTTISARVARSLRRVTPEPAAVQRLRTVTGVRDHRFFAGAIAPGDWPGLGRVAFRLMGGRYRDARDWDDVDAWATVIGHAIAQGTRDDGPR